MDKQKQEAKTLALDKKLNQSEKDNQGKEAETTALCVKLARSEKEIQGKKAETSALRAELVRSGKDKQRILVEKSGLHRTLDERNRTLDGNQNQVQKLEHDLDYTGQQWDLALNRLDDQVRKLKEQNDEINQLHERLGDIYDTEAESDHRDIEDKDEARSSMPKRLSKVVGNYRLRRTLMSSTTRTLLPLESADGQVTTTVQMV